DVTGRIVSREEYAPYGGTTGCDEAATEVSRLAQRTRRYSGKELDATGLYYYGWRYYQPTLGRWLSADPGGLVDGVNLFQFCTNNSVNRTDWDGRMPPPVAPRPESTLSAASTFLPIVPKNKVERRDKRIAVSYQKMSKGTMWKGAITAEDDVKNISKKNIEALLGRLQLTAEEKKFVESTKEIPYKLIHFTKSQIKANGKVSIKSSDLLDSKGGGYNLYSATNGDVLKLNTTGFAFFSLGVEGAAGKPSSRFGRYKWEIPLAGLKDNVYLQHAHMALNDTLEFNFVETSSARLSASFGEDDVERVQRAGSLFNSAADTLFHYDNFTDGLALHLVSVGRLLSSDAQKKILSSVDDKAKFDEMISLLCRPQILVPSKLASEYFKSTTL
ncbi:RHS repeat-associated core domain-containing protein, partial [Pseudomonas sp. Q1]|uniref:RHS repeat-associated core domain-containing protein n=1 Tax=Pseudomonas sp. Q1 TaxID=2202823 RepID=UPI001374D256